eukprot:TRINITY_DN4183_c0_g1_i1.p1 TRINITY_DN4183_c0_g1~~TRINITY_DN4183_c0_g1_i1.p1  ORF type:complete len:503 (-),score=169.11 TRINITY_DN4183_c0_g1_i1:111-1619(-)
MCIRDRYQRRVHGELKKEEMEGAQTALNVESTAQLVEKQVTENIIPSLLDFVRIPNLSRLYDPEWKTNGLLEKAANFLIDWVKSQNIKGLSIELVTEPERPPLIFAEIAPSQQGAGTILFYGHYDKQPHMLPWREGLGPVTPVIEDDKLYGRGGADDGYAIYASLLSIKLCQDQGIPHPRAVIMIEGDEESGSAHLPFYFEKLAARIGTPDIIVCLDSGCPDYETLWITTTLRGVLVGTLKVDIISEGVHSGDASGIVPSTFRIARQILDRIDDPVTGEVNEAFKVNIPPERYAQAYQVAEHLGQKLIDRYPFLPGTKPVSTDPLQAYLNRIWRPALSIVGADGLAPTATAGNVLRPSTSLRISLRLPPTLNPHTAEKAIQEILTRDPPYNAKVSVTGFHAGSGWNAPAFKPFLTNIISSSSKNFFKRDVLFFGEGGSIPFLGFLGEKYPNAQFVVAGLLGPGSNAHGPNEFLHITYLKKLICCMTQIVADSTPHISTQKSA